MRLQRTPARRASGTAERRPIPAELAHKRATRPAARPRPLQQQQARGDGPAPLGRALLGAAAGLALLAPGPGLAAEALPPPQQLQAVSAPAPARLACLSDLAEAAAAPDLVTDMEVEMAEAAEANPLVNGLEWVVEEGLEVTNFRESNFAAVGAPSSSMWLSNSPWCMVWDAYCNVLTNRPVATKLATGMVGTLLGDLLAQATQGLVNTTSGSARGSGGGGAGRRQQAALQQQQAQGGFTLDVNRTARLVAFSALVGTPVAFVWYNLLDQFVMPGDPTAPLAVALKVAMDQVLMAPCMTSVFFASMALLEGDRGAAVAGRVRSRLRPTLLANWTVWPLAHVVNFALVPPAQRILYINVVNIAWTAFMSHMASSSSSSSSEEAAPRGAKQLQQAGR